MMTCHVAPSYQIAVSDGRITTEPVAGLIDFDAQSVVGEKYLVTGAGRNGDFDAG